VGGVKGTRTSKRKQLRQNGSFSYALTPDLEPSYLKYISIVVNIIWKAFLPGDGTEILQPTPPQVSKSGLCSSVVLVLQIIFPRNLVLDLKLPLYKYEKYVDLSRSVFQFSVFQRKSSHFASLICGCGQRMLGMINVANFIQNV